MGCVSSKLDGTAVKDHHHPREINIFTKPNSTHLVCLTSTTYGILNSGASKEVSCSNHTEPEQVETINAWELMYGLDEESPAASPAKAKDFDEAGSLPRVGLSGTQHGGGPLLYPPVNAQKSGLGKENERPAGGDSPRSPYGKENLGSAKTNGLGPGVSPLRERNLVAEVNSQNMSGAKGSIADNAGAKSFRSKQVCRKISHGPLSDLNVESFRGNSDNLLREMDANSPLFDPELLASFESSLDGLCEGKEWSGVGHGQRKLNSPLENFEEKCPPGGENALVLYTTTLRGIRKTFEDCNNVRCVLESFRICINERDVSMHLQFRNELEELMGGIVPVPRVFIKGRYIGGVEKVLALHEEGKLGGLLEGIPTDTIGRGCDGCGGVRFVPCLECSGSCKLVNDENSVVRCPDCNENGLIQCPICC